MADYIDRILYVEKFMHPWDESNLIMADNFFNVYLDLVCQCFHSVFVHQSSWEKFVCNSLSLLNFVSFQYHGNCGLICWQYMLHSLAHRNKLNFSLYLFLSSLVWACFHGSPRPRPVPKVISGLSLFLWRLLNWACSRGSGLHGPDPVEVTGIVLLQCRSLTQFKELSFPFGNIIVINFVYLNNAFYLTLEINLFIGIIAKNFAKEMPTWSTGV